ncbi:hypothetical protein [Bacillus kwashiorkori]|uniref:hypothetical protein n=1 Tax=Bacillus kwashiorkori TaxID=1522318 RepID=UPI0007810C78|nr:hypothetical protein [Bacillus kwashiorkori]
MKKQVIVLFFISFLLFFSFSTAKAKENFYLADWFGKFIQNYEKNIALVMNIALSTMEASFETTMDNLKDFQQDQLSNFIQASSETSKNEVANYKHHYELQLEKTKAELANVNLTDYEEAKKAQLEEEITTEVTQFLEEILKNNE